MARFMRNLTNALRPFKRIRREIGAIRSELNAIRTEIRTDIIAHSAYETMRDLNLVDKDKNLLMFYHRIGGRISISVCHDFTIMQRYLNAVRPVRVKNLVRVGGTNDGGYIMINPKIDLLESMQDSSHNSPPPPYLLDNPPQINFSQNQPFALSLGVSPYSPWDLDMANFGYKVLQYDASIDKAPYNHPNITFYKKFVGARDSHDTISFENLLAQHDFNPNACNVLQCDIEDCEWEILENIDLAKIAQYFSQIIFEFHGCNPNDKSATQRRIAVLEKIKEHYTPIHSHFNSFGAIIYQLNGYFWSSLVEVSYLRNDLVDKDAKKVVGVGNLYLDSPNEVVGSPDIPVIFGDF
ncbi:hypothetical protein [Helicobacter sp. T3_23-1056]